VQGSIRHRVTCRRGLNLRNAFACRCSNICQSKSCVGKLRSFPIGRNERNLPDKTYTSAEDFLQRMDAGEFDGNLGTEIKKLSREQLEQLAHALMERDQKRRG
jgi:hypothetical protein